MREAVKSVKKFLTAPSWQDYVIRPVGALNNTGTDELLDAFAAAGSETIWHPVGTASMSAREAKGGVVDPDLLVKKVKGLRIVDASVLVSASFHSTLAGYKTDRVGVHLALYSECTHASCCLCFC